MRRKKNEEVQIRRIRKNRFKNVTFKILELNQKEN